MKAKKALLDLQLNKLAPVFKDDAFLSVGWHQCAADRRDVEFTFEQLGKLPDVLRKHVLSNANNFDTRFERNTYIRTTTEKLVGFLPKKLRNQLTVDDSEIRAIATECSDRCRRLAIFHNVTFYEIPNPTEYNQTNSEIRRNFSLTGLPVFPNSVNVTNRNNPLTELSITGVTELYRKIAKYTESFGADSVPISSNGITELGAIRRMCEKIWWLRKLRKVFNQAYEKAALHLGLVCKQRQIYASNLTVNKRQQQIARNNELLSSVSVINDVGQQFTLKELSDLNVSNPAVRKAELMVRMRGFEEISKSHNHVGLFVTITCPSKYHAVLSKSGQKNPKYQGFTPYQANQYLCDVWAKTRAQWNREGIKPYGFRVAEPQHDGTPHWHILLFVEKHQVERVKSVISHYSLLEDGDERGAKENRCDFKLIDPKKGSATGYIAKYVSKNIDGEGLDKGVYGEDPITAAQRVDAWSSCWCIRQFQQIGGASVSVWRELRRLKQKLGFDSLVEHARQAADESNWHDYINTMGGVFMNQKDQPLKLAYEAKADLKTGECKLGQYDGDVIHAVKGLLYKGQTIVTRFFQWRLEKQN